MRRNVPEQQPTLEVWWASTPDRPPGDEAARRATDARVGEAGVAAEDSGAGTPEAAVPGAGRADPDGAETPPVKTSVALPVPPDARTPHRGGRQPHGADLSGAGR